MTTAQYLSRLSLLRADTFTNLISKGVSAQSNDTLSTLVPLILNIEQGKPLDISTAANMTAVLGAANVGRVYRFTGTTDNNYMNGELYMVATTSGTTTEYVFDHLRTYIARYDASIAHDGSICVYVVNSPSNPGCYDLQVVGIGAMDNYTFSGGGKMAPWRVYKDGIKRVIVNEGITAIGDVSLWGCEKATEVSLPSTLKTLGWASFGQYYALPSIVVPEGVTSIGNACFTRCSALTSIYLPNTLTTIDVCAFERCTSLRKIYIPSSVTTMKSGTGTIGQSQFGVCDAWLKIYCGAQGQPTGWFSMWNCYNSVNYLTAYWGYTRAEYNTLT